MSEPVSATPPTPPTPPATAPRRRWGRLLLIGAGTAIALLAVLVALAPALVSTSWANGIIRGWVSENLEREVDIASLDVTWTRGVVLKGLVVHDEFAGQPPMLEAPAVALRVPLLRLLTRNFEVDELVIEDAVLRVVDRGEETNTARALRMKKRRKRPEDTTEDAPLVLPDIRVPVRVENLTLVLVDEEGHEARRPGIDFTGRLNTRSGPTTFDLSVPTGGGTVDVEGKAVLFDAEGALLAKQEMRVDTTVTVTNVDARANADLLALFLPGRPTSGTLDAKFDAVYEGDVAKATVDLRIRGVAIAPADANGAAAPAGQDVTLRGKFEFGNGRLGVRDLDVAAEGLAIRGDLAGTWPALDGRIDVDADLARMSAALAAFGIQSDESLSGRAKGEITFTASPAAGRGTLALTGFRAESRTRVHEPVVVDSARMTFAGSGEGEVFRLDAFELVLADMTAHASGTIARSGRVDLKTTAKGDLGGLLGRGRDLGLLPSGLSVNGTLDAAVAVAGTPGGEGADGLSVTIDRLLLTEQDVRIEAKGRAQAGGEIDLTATGEGDLGKLLGRARAAGMTGAGGPDLSAVRGRFAFAMSAKGPASAVVVRVAELRIDGDLKFDASGELRMGGEGGGTLDGKLHADGRVDDAIALARGLGVLDRDLRLEGILRADAAVTGTLDAPQVPSFAVAIAGPVLTFDANGSIDASKRLTATVKADGDVAKLGEVAVRAGFVEKLPPLRGRVTLDAAATGTSDRVEIPTATLTLRGGPATVDVKASLDGDGKLNGTANVDGALADIGRYAHEAGWAERAMTPAGRVTVRATFAGAPDRIAFPEVVVTTTELLDLTAKGSIDADRAVDVTASFSGRLQPLLDAAAQWTGGEATRLDGTLEGSAHVGGGVPDALTVKVPNVSVRAGQLSLTAVSTRDVSGDGEAKLTVTGPVADLLATLHAFDVAKDMNGTGTVRITADARTVAKKATGSFSADVRDLVLTRPAEAKGEEPWTIREPHASLTVANFTYEMETKRLAPVPLSLRLDGAEVDATVGLADGPANAEGVPGKIVDAKGTLLLEGPFARNHAELLSGIVFERAAGPFSFAGDISRGREGAAGWTGGTDLQVTGFVAPHVRADTAHVVAKIVDGVIVADPIEGTVNGGPVTGNARIGLVGEEPEHTFDLTGKDVGLQEDLAPLVARAAPIFALGDSGGRTGGRAAVDVHLRARGFDGDVVKRTMTGKGTLQLDDAFVESTGWIGTLFSIVGGSGRLDIQPVAVPFDVQQGRVRTGEVAMQGLGGLLLRLGGDVGLDGKLDYGLRVKSGSKLFEKYASYLDPEGFLPLRLEGKIAKPKLRAPDVKDVVKGKLQDLLGGLLGKDDDKEPPKDDREERRRRRRENQRVPDEPPLDEPPPPPPPRGDQPPPEEEEPPPPPPPRER